jgi:CYTH domain-containing protein
VQKNRYKVTISGRPAEVDVFTGELNGLVVIDFEFDSPEEKAKFQPPTCCLADVTQEDFIAGGLLAGKSYQDIATDLERYNYKPLSV